MTDESTDDQTSPEGWWVAHLFYKVTHRSERGPVELALKAFVESGHQVVTVAMLGHRSDLGIMAIGPSAASIRHLQTELRKANLELVDSYLSRTEISEYAKGLPPEMVEARLRPNLPPDGMPAYCFYPMSKRRVGEDNWYRLDFDHRSALMRAHGAVGREFRGRIVQLITGSTGLDDDEWGVTLFGRTPDDLKACVYEMRFDEGSARFAEFGRFLTGTVGDPDRVLRDLGLD
ncbi:MAG TPA: chlorite dismutase family protein [Acidimicrobiales bacterium]|nr:chlorite dismutase family protein [Acidimicrobiales bacterium]